MKCVICKHEETKSGRATVNLQRGESVIIIKNVPADICQNCGEDYLSQEMTRWVLQKAEEAIKQGAEVQIIRYVA